MAEAAGEPPAEREEDVSNAPGGTDDEGDAEEVDEHAQYISENSPTKRKPRSDVWSVIKRLTGEHPQLEKGYTHICQVPLKSDPSKFCNQLLKLTR